MPGGTSPNPACQISSCKTNATLICRKSPSLLSACPPLQQCIYKAHLIDPS